MGRSTGRFKVRECARMLLIRKLLHDLTVLNSYNSLESADRVSAGIMNQRTKHVGLEFRAFKQTALQVGLSQNCCLHKSSKSDSKLASSLAGKDCQNCFQS